MGGVYVWGTGCGAGELLGQLPPELELAGYVESSPAAGRFLEKELIDPETLAAREPELVLVTARQADEIRARCDAVGIARDRLLFVKNPCGVLDRNEGLERARRLLGGALTEKLVPRMRLLREPLRRTESPLDERELDNDYVRVKTLELVCRRLREVPGAAAELGVYRGGFARCINALLPDRTLYLFDSFEGFDEAEAARELALGRASEGLVRAHRETSAQRVLDRLPHPERAALRPGLFPASLDGLEERFAFVSLDVDLEESSYAGLVYFVPRMNAGGVMFLHDWDSPTLTGVSAALTRYERERGRRLPALPLCDLNGTLAICF